MGRIAVNGLLLRAAHGVSEQERRVGTDFEVSLWVDVPMSERAEVTDSLDDTISYAELVEIAREQMAVPSLLIEHAAGRIARAIRQRYGAMIAAGEVTVAKLAPPITAQLRGVSYTCRIPND